MVFKQETALKPIDPLDVIRSFHTYRFVEYLTFGQPVKIENWKGIDDGKTASALGSLGLKPKPAI